MIKVLSVFGPRLEFIALLEKRIPFYAPRSGEQLPDLTRAINALRAAATI